MADTNYLQRIQDAVRRSPLVAGIVLAVVVILIVIIVASLALGSGKRAAAMRAFTNLADASTYHTKSELTLKLPPLLRGKERPFTDVVVRLDGDVAYTDVTPEFSGTLYTEARGRGNIFFADGDIRLLTDSVAFNLENLPVLLNPTGSLVKKWTYVDVPTLTTQNPEEVKTALAAVFDHAQYAGTDKSSGRSLYRYTVVLTPEDEQALTDVLRFSRSGNRGLQVLARIFNNPQITSLQIWVDGRAKQVAKIEVAFALPRENADPYNLGTLTMEFSDFGKAVVVERPDKQLTAKPEVFAKIFGSGEIAPQQ